MPSTDPRLTGNHMATYDVSIRRIPPPPCFSIQIEIQIDRRKGSTLTIGPIDELGEAILDPDPQMTAHFLRLIDSFEQLKYLPLDPVTFDNLFARAIAYVRGVLEEGQDHDFARRFTGLISLVRVRPFREDKPDIREILHTTYIDTR